MFESSPTCKYYLYGIGLAFSVTVVEVAPKTTSRVKVGEVIVAPPRAVAVTVNVCYYMTMLRVGSS